MNSPSQLLAHFGLARNPYTDRTAEKTLLDEQACYVLADLQGFKPSPMTYLFFGRRGSGKTTIRLHLQHLYDTANAKLRQQGEKPYYILNLTKPTEVSTHMQAFKERCKINDDEWDARFAAAWTAQDMVDILISCAITDLVNLLMQEILNKSTKLLDKVIGGGASSQFLLLAHIYAKVDIGTLQSLYNHLKPRAELLENFTSAAQTTSVAAVAIGGAYYASKTRTDIPTTALLAGAASLATFSASIYIQRWRQQHRSRERAASLAEKVRVVQPPVPLPGLQEVLDKLFTAHDTAGSLQGLLIGHSCNQKLANLRSLLQVCGYGDLAVFGDCFDECSQLDPVTFPSTIRAFATQVCRNEILNFGGLHFFFPGTRAGILNLLIGRIRLRLRLRIKKKNKE